VGYERWSAPLPRLGGVSCRLVGAENVPRETSAIWTGRKAVGTWAKPLSG